MLAVLSKGTGRSEDNRTIVKGVCSFVTKMHVEQTRVLRAYDNYVPKYIGENRYIGIVFRAVCCALGDSR